MIGIKASVIIPNYNHSAFLKERLDTVLQQTFQDFEVIILDDCSTDSSREIIENYRRHPKVSAIVYNKENSGSPFKQWQKGIALAKGDWLWIAESDDYSEPMFLEKALCSLDQTKDASLFFCQSKEVDEQGRLIGDMHWLTATIQNYNWDAEFCVSGDDFARTALLQKNVIVNASGVVFRKSPGLTNYLRRIVQYKMCGDWLFWSYIIQGHKVMFTPEKLNYFRSHHHSTRSNLSGIRMLRRVSEEVSVIRKIKRIYNLRSDSDISLVKLRSTKYRLIRELSNFVNLVQLLNFYETAAKSSRRIVKLPA